MHKNTFTDFEQGRTETGIGSAVILSFVASWRPTTLYPMSLGLLPNIQLGLGGAAC